MKTHDEISAVILSSGNSSRMNIPKAFLKFNDEKTFLEKIVETYIQSGITKIIIVINPTIIEKATKLISKYTYTNNVKLILNRFGEWGRFYSIRLGLFNSESSFSFLQNIDNPFISVALLEKMINQISPSNFVVPVCQNKEGHPILLSKNIINHLITLKGNDYHLKNELTLFTKSKLEWIDENILFNINTPEDYKNYVLTCKTSIEY